MLRDHILFSKPSKNSVSLLSCNFKGLVFDFYLKRKRNNDFAGNVINTVGLEDIGCRWYLYKLLTGFRQKFLKITFESLWNKFHLEFFNGSHRVSSLVR